MKEVWFTREDMAAFEQENLNHEQFLVQMAGGNAQMRVSPSLAIKFFLTVARSPKNLLPAPEVRRWAFAIAIFQWIILASWIGAVVTLCFKHWIWSLLLIIESLFILHAIRKSAAAEVARLAHGSDSWYEYLKERKVIGVWGRSDDRQ